MRRGRRREVEKVSKDILIDQFKVIFKDLKPYYKTLFITLIFSVFGAILTIVGPNQVAKLTNAIAEGIMLGINLEYVKKLSFILLTLYLGSFLFTYIKDILLTIVTQKYSKNLRTKLSEKLNKVPLKYFDNNETGDILSRVSNDIDTISQTLNQSIGGLTSAVVTLIGVLIMMFKTNVVMSLTTIGASLFGMGLLVLIMMFSQKYFVLAQQKLGEINGHIEEVYSSLIVVKTYNGKEEVSKKFNSLNEELLSASFKSRFTGGLMPQVMNFIGAISFVSVSVVGSFLVMKGSITVGVIVAYMLYARLFSSPLATLSQALNSLQSTAAASKRVYSFLSEEELSSEVNIKKKISVKDALGKIEFKNVNFGYTDKLVIKNLSAKFEPSTKVAIVGPTGAGKTTIVNLLMKFYEINSGSILIDDINISELSRENVQCLFTMVLQDTWVFDGTIKENIIFNQKDITLEDVKKVAKEVKIDHLINTLPQGYDTYLGESDLLSSGEKQLITIARAMLEGAPFLILDEATSNVDVRTEKQVQSAMYKLMKDKTTFIIAHRLSTIKNADVILVLDQGNVVEMGGHEELLNKNGFYKELYDSQFEV